MELHFDQHGFTHRLPNWPAAIVSGFMACAFFSAVEMLTILLMTGQSPWIPSRMVAAIVMGRGVLPPPATFDLGVVVMALIVHFALGAVLGAILGLIVAAFRFDSDIGMVSLAGAVFGLLVYGFNFYVMTQFFPWFTDSRDWMMVMGHIVFGAFAGYMYWVLSQVERPSGRILRGSA